MSNHHHHHGQHRGTGQQGQEHKHEKHEHMAELGALAAGAFAKHEAHQVKVDPVHAGRHRDEESIAGAIAVGLGGLLSTSIRRRNVITSSRLRLTLRVNMGVIKTIITVSSNRV